MTNKIRQSVHVPDHDVLRKIGGGAYGEVWLARGVTGAWRAVKVVWREDFEDERGFEREFEGILKYEPISRDHPALVNILHVGRSSNKEDAFYYYVMELGDDFHTGAEINAVEYEARTLRSDLVTADGSPLDLDFCLEVAVRLSESLAYLHDRGLAHRDVKPSNVIFVGGKAKLADIGLVAPRDQRTFVGTEGFVPPEGPGSAQADLYSLGKVLYEMMTGKDRLQFPELPDDLPTGEKRQLWLNMNQLICDVCEPKQTKRKITTAVEFAEAVKRLQQGKKLRKLRLAYLVKLVALLLIAGIGFVGFDQFKKLQGARIVSPHSSGGEVLNGDENEGPVNEVCAIKVNTTPPFATVFENGEMLEGITPIDLREFTPGEVVTYRFELEGHKSFEKSYTVPDQDIWVIHETLETYRPPVENVVWEDPLGMEYSPREGFHISSLLRSSQYAAYIKESQKKDDAKRIPYSESGEGIEIVLLTRAQAEEFVSWLEAKSVNSGLLTSEHMMQLKQDVDLAAVDFTAEDQLDGVLPTRVIVKEIPFASVELKSVPSGARVYIENAMVGMTPMTMEKLRPGALQIELRMDGYQKFVQELQIKDNDAQQHEFLLRPNDGVVFDTKWVNSLKMPMVPVREGLMAAATETRVSDYQAFVAATQHREPKRPGFRQDSSHPVVGVSKADAQAFCAWLTKKERAEEKISETHRYKLPSDLEWSLLAGLAEREDESPSERDYRAQRNPQQRNQFFWGRRFPPQGKVANLADEAAAKAVGISKNRTIANYNDGYDKTSPVGSFPANALGLHDVCGNVYEWVESDYKEGSSLAVARGGSWATYTKGHLRVWSRFLSSSSQRGNQFGFRIVLVDETEQVFE